MTDRAKAVRIEATYHEHTDHEDGSFSGRRVTRNGVFLPVNPDGSVGEFEEWMVGWTHHRISLKQASEASGIDFIWVVDVDEYIATAISSLLAAAKDGEK